MKASRDRAGSREEGEEEQDVRKEGGFQRHSSVLTGAKHGKLD